MTHGLIALIAVPIIGAVLALLPAITRGQRERISLAATLVNLILAIGLFHHEAWLTLPWAGGGFGFAFALRLYHFSGFILLATAGFSFLISLYCAAFMAGKRMAGQFHSYFLLTLAFANGAALADNLLLFLFFWEGMALTLFGLIIIGHPGAFKTAIKALIICGVTDLCLMFGIGLTYQLAGTMTISQISLPVDKLGAVAFLFMAVGAMSKAGAMPFHSWIPDAAVDAPLPFMAFLPAAIEKLLGIYLLARLSLNMFRLSSASWVSLVLMIVGAVTILLAVAMALIQKDYKRLLSYHAISQVGYMILGIGTATPVGIVGGLFHMINHAMYKSCLFLTGGSVERQAGTTDLRKLGGLGRKMPVTMTCFIVAACAISGVPPLNGFFSKELVYDGALERHWIFYAAALLGSFLTAASFLKLGHAAYFGKLSDERKEVREAPVSMLVPMIAIAAFCVLFGVYNPLPLRHLIQPILGERMQGHDFSGLPHSALLVIMTVVCLVAAYLNHRWGARRSGSGLGAVDHIHHAPVLEPIYNLAERRFFDPYDVAVKFVSVCAKLAFETDRAVDWLYNTFTVKLTYAFTKGIRQLHNGSYATYIVWSLIGVLAVVI
ncbi:MAG TPA: proton-conducting transporter membrane subunit, partial [Terriglobales bacterium]